MTTPDGDTPMGESAVDVIDDAVDASTPAAEEAPNRPLDRQPKRPPSSWILLRAQG